MIELLTAKEGSDNLSLGRLTPPDPREAGVFEGALTSPFVGVKHAWDIGAAGLADAVMPTLEKYTPEAASDWLKEQRAVAYNSMKETRADPMNMGVVAQVGHALGSVLTMGLAGGLIAGPAGAAGAIGGGSMYDKYKELRDQNVDRETALDVAGVTGAVMAVSSALPAFMGKTITTQVLSGIGMNVPLGMVERGGSSELLENAGYAEMAKHYKAMDGAAIAVDMVLGAAFPLGMRALRRNVPLAEMDSAMDANRTIANDNVHPALPGTLEDAAAVKAAEDSFARQLLEEGKTLEEIIVPSKVYENSVENPAVAKAAAEQVTAFNDLAAKEGYAPLNKMESDVDSMGRAYADSYEESMSIKGKHSEIDIESVDPLSPSMVRYYHGGDPSGVTGSLWFTSDIRDAIGWMGRDQSMSLWYVDVDKNSPVRGGDSEFGILPPSRMEMPAEISNRRKKFNVKPPVEAKAEGKMVEAHTSDRASNIIAQKEGMTVVDDNGQVVKASDLVKKAEADFKQEQKEIDLYKVAIECAVRVGT